MQLTSVCDPFPHCVLLALTTDSSKTHTQVSCLRPAFFFFCFFFLLLIVFFFLSDAEYSSLTSKKPAYCFLLKADKCLSLGEITVCASKQLFQLVTKKKKKSPSESIP